MMDLLRGMYEWLRACFVEDDRMLFDSPPPMSHRRRLQLEIATLKTQTKSLETTIGTATLYGISIKPSTLQALQESRQLLIELEAEYARSTNAVA